MTYKYDTHIFIIIRHHEKNQTVKLMQFYRMLVASKIYPAKIRSNNYGKYTLVSLIFLEHA